MRCPKCGFISFDHLDECLKCKKNIKASTATLGGFVLNVKPPSFLDLQPPQNDDDAEKAALDDEFVDNDLDILIEEDEHEEEVAEISLDDDEAGEIELPGSISMADEEEDREIEIDLSQFEDASQPEVAPTGGSASSDDQEEISVHLDLPEEEIQVALPEELSDMSDLAPPKKDEKTANAAFDESGDTDFPDLELDDLNFDLGLDDLDTEMPTSPKSKKETVLALDDIDFPDTLAPGGDKKGLTGKNMDDDLDIELDLGGLTIHKDV
jgi:hypothetical protein